MDKIFLITVTLIAIYYLYKSTFKNKACNCGKDSCSINKKIK